TTYTFSVQNNNPIPIKITEIGAYHYSSGNCGGVPYDMWYTTNTAQATGTTATVSAPTWTFYGQSPVIPAPSGVKPYFTNTSLIVQPNTLMRIAFSFPYQYNGCSFFAPNGTPSGGPVYSANGVDLMSGTNQYSNGLFGQTGSTLSGSRYFYGYITFVPASIPCADTVDNAVVIGPDKICPNKPFALAVGLPNGIFMSDLTYQWQYSMNGVTWANFTGVPDPLQGGKVVDSITATKWYRCKITCTTNNSSYTTPAHKVDIYPFYYCYCDNSVTSDAGADIGNLTIINTNKFDSVYKKGQLVTGSATPVYSNSLANRVYTPYHDSLGWPCLYRDTTYLYNVTQIHSGGSFETGVVQAYIDYDRDGLYNPNTERIFVRAMDGLNTNPHIVQVTAKVPSTAEIGPTGLRVIISKDTVKGAPCDTISGGGEVEDYIVEICHRPCNGAVNAGVVVSTDTSMCAGYEYTLTDTTYEK
ncbi:MAG: hypothetical protein K8F30_01045, partial [Taibaiella sp.]|nr:hypothetical protein [Taibaiella sp.]